MRFAEWLWRCVLVLALGAGLSGCATVADPMKALRRAMGTSPASTEPQAVASAPQAVPAKPKPAPEVPVSPTVQRAYDEAQRALRRGRMEEAERGFQAIAKSNPELGGPHANLGLIYRQGGKLQEAATEFELATAANPQQALYFNQLGISYRQLGQFTKARDAYERAIALDPGYAAAHLNLGILHDLYLSDSKRALERYDSYLAVTPGGDPLVTKWIADLKNRKPPIAVSRKEKE